MSRTKPSLKVPFKLGRKLGNAETNRTPEINSQQRWTSSLLHPLSPPCLPLLPTAQQSLRSKAFRHSRGGTGLVPAPGGKALGPQNPPTSQSCHESAGRAGRTQIKIHFLASLPGGEA